MISRGLFAVAVTSAILFLEITSNGISALFATICFIAVSYEILATVTLSVAVSQEQLPCQRVPCCASY